MRGDAGWFRGTRGMLGAPGLLGTRVLLTLLLLLPLACRSTEEIAELRRTPPSPKAMRWFEEGRTRAGEGNLSGAASAFHKAVRLSRNSTLEEDARYEEAHARYLVGDLWAAFQGYQELVRLFPFSRHLEAVEKEEYDLARRIEKGEGKRFLFLFDLSGSRSRDAYRHLVEHFPRGPYAADAGRRVAGYYFDNEVYDEAVLEYETLRRNFPDSEWRELADFRTAVCYARIAQGPDYDPTPYLRAVREFRAYLQNHPEGIHHQEALEEFGQVQEALARSDVDVASFYVKMKEWEGARFHLKRASEQWPETPAAQEARDRLASLPPPATGEDSTTAPGSGRERDTGVPARDADSAESPPWEESP